MYKTNLTKARGHIPPSLLSSSTVCYVITVRHVRVLYIYFLIEEVVRKKNALITTGKNNITF